MKKIIQYIKIASVVLFLFFTSTTSAHSIEKTWYPVKVDVWDSPFNVKEQKVQKIYTPLNKAKRKWKFHVYIPHLKDAYWKGVNYGLIEEARRLGIQLRIWQAGGYGQLAVQRKQIQRLLNPGYPKPDGIIISAISASGLKDLVKDLSDQKIPVIDLINGISSHDIKARVAVSFHDMGFQTGQYLLKLQQKSEKPFSVGPKGAGWVAAGNKGFRDALNNSSIKILTNHYGDTGRTTQGLMVQSTLKKYKKKINFIVGTAVTAETSIGILKKMGLLKHTNILSYYYTPGVNRGIKNGEILAAPTDQPVIQARIAVDTLVRIIEKKAYYKHVAPQIIVVDQNNIDNWDSTTTLAPEGFNPTFSINK